mgnify:CR=1 FL=1
MYDEFMHVLEIRLHMISENIILQHTQMKEVT